MPSTLRENMGVFLLAARCHTCGPRVYPYSEEEPR